MTVISPIKIAKGPSLAESVYRELRSDLVQGRLAPGAQLKAGELAARFGISLAAVREALARLSAEELVEAEPQRGFRAASVSAEQLQDLTAVRIDIEVMCLRQSIARYDLLADIRLEDAMQALVDHAAFDADGHHVLTDEWSRAHIAFHEILVSGCGSDVLLRIRRQLFDQAERYRSLSTIISTGERDIERDHRPLVEAVRRRDADGAAALLAEHIRETAQILLAAKHDGAPMLPRIRQAA